jgi:MFS family permease
MTGVPRPAGRTLGAFAGVFSITFLALFSVGIVLPVLPLYIRGPLGAGDFAVGFLVGAFAFTGVAGRPIAGYLADTRGRRLVAMLGCGLAVIAGLLYFVPGGIPTLLLSRLVLGAGEGMVFTAGAAWVVDLAPEDRRGRVIGLYGLSVWTALSAGPPIGDLLYRALDFEAVWAVATVVPLAAAFVAARVPEGFRSEDPPQRRALIAPEALGPGAALALKTWGFAALASFIVLMLDERGIGHGAAAFTAFAAMVVITRLVAGDLPDRVGPLRCALGAALVEALGLSIIAASDSLQVAIAGAMIMGAAFSTLYPALSLHVVNQVSPNRRGVALGTFTAFFDVGMAIGSPVVGVAAALWGYEAAFWVGAGAALLAAGVVLLLRRGSADPLPGASAASPAPPRSSA